MIEARNLSYKINDTVILKDVSFKIQAAAFVGLLGPNGSGKTTVMRLLCGYYRNYEGDITLAGKPLRHLTTRELAQQIAVVPQEAHFAFEFSALDIVLMGRSVYQKSFAFDSADDFKIAKDCMQKTECWQFRDRDIKTLSGGERQRVLLARALAQQPQILLLDEPASHLDLKHQAQIFNLLSEMNQQQNLTIVCVVHDPAMAKRFCHEVLFLKQGCLMHQGLATDGINHEKLKELYDIDFTTQPTLVPSL